MASFEEQALPDNVSQLLDAAADRYGVPRALARAVAWVESHGRQGAVGSKGEIGVMQLMAATAEDLGVNAYSLTENIEGGVRLLSGHWKRMGERKAVAAYNAGAGAAALNEDRWPKSTQQYVAKVFLRVPIERAFMMGARPTVDPFEDTPAELPTGRRRLLSSQPQQSPCPSGSQPSEREREDDDT